MVAYSFMRRFVDPIRVGLGLLKVSPLDNLPLPKRQTIRAIGKRRHAKVGDVLQLYTGMRTRNCEKIGDATCVRVSGVHLKLSEWQSFFTFDLWEPEPNVYRRHGDLRAIDDIDAFARADGFDSFAGMELFWRENHGAATFEGLLIEWEPR